MTKQNQIYKCQVCGNITEVLHTGAGELVCCNQPMVLEQENTVDASREKHVPVIEQTENSTKVKVGSIPHPMDPDHYIEWIEVKINAKVGKKFLKPGDLPEAEFCRKAQDAPARAYCNLYGLWSA